MRVINDDPLGQTQGPASCDIYSHLNFVLFCEILKSGDGRTEGQKTRAKIVITTSVTVVRPRGSKNLKAEKVASMKTLCFGYKKRISKNKEV